MYAWNKPRVGKNPNGWFVALPKWGGDFDVIEGLPSQQAAFHVAYEYAGLPWSKRR